jgi:argininosuccinate lyase
MLKEIEDGTLVVEGPDEDVHTWIERTLTGRIGPAAGRLHTARSRNDQVGAALRLYVRESVLAVSSTLLALLETWLSQSSEHLTTWMPGYTHLQRAQPVLFAHHLLAYAEMVDRDKGRLQDALSRLDELPLGAGALAGTNYPIDRTYVAKLLGFSRVTANSLDTVSDRDFVIETLSALSILMMHLSRLSEELVLWSSQEFQFVTLPDAFCTGSSMMPQKKNPDVPELIRGKTGRVYGHLFALLTTLKGLPLSYNRDLQEDKEALFDALDTVTAALQVLTELIKGLTVHRAALARAAGSGYLLATELADYLVAKGVPFREAHHTTGRLVRACLESKRGLHDLTLTDLCKFSEHFEKDALDVLTVEGAIERKGQVGGTARKQVEARLKALEKALT